MGWAGHAGCCEQLLRMRPAPTHNDLRGLYDRTGMNFFVCDIDGAWHGGWFRIDGSQLEVNSQNQCRSVTIVDPDLLTELLRKVMAEIARESRSTGHATYLRNGQELASASLRGSTPDVTFSGYRSKEREQ